MPVEYCICLPDLFDKYVDRNGPNPCDIEHVIADNFSLYSSTFISNEEFQSWSNHVASLLILPADVKGSIDKNMIVNCKPVMKTKYGIILWQCARNIVG